MRVFTLLLLFLIAACGDDDGGGGATDGPPIDWMGVIDAVDAPPVCGISSMDFGDLGEVTGGSAVMQGGNGNGLAELLLPITTGTVPDRLAFDMWGGTKHHPGPIAAGSYDLTGIQTATHTCTVCVAIGAMWPDGGPPNFEFVYQATGGTANVTMIDPNPGGVLELELTAVTFQHVRVQGGMSTPLEDGCVTKIDHLVYRGNFEGAAKQGPSL